MSVYTVCRDDFTNAARSYIVLGVVGVFAALVALIFLAEMNIYDDPYRALFDVSFFVFLVFPLFLAPLSYLAVAGDRESGVIKYVMGLPNARHEYVLGKFVSRVSVGLAAVVVGVIAGYAVALATFANAPSADRFLRFAFVSLLYVFAFVGLFVGLSAFTNRRSRAMLGVFGAYFVLVPFWFGFLPVIGLPTIINTVADVFGVTVSRSTQLLINSLSPATSYLMSTEIVYHGVIGGQYESINRNFAGQSDEFYRQFWFNALVMLAWGAGGLLAGYLSFRRSELG